MVVAWGVDPVRLHTQVLRFESHPAGVDTAISVS